MLTNLTKFALALGFIILFSGFNEPNAFVFSTNKSEFLEELRSFIQSTNNQDHYSLFQKFEGQIKDNKFDASEFEEIVLVCNKMSAKSMTAAPYFTEYLKSLNLVKFKQVGQNNFMDWHETLQLFLDDLEKKDYRRYQTYLVFSQKLFNDEPIRRARGGIDWTASGSTPAVSWQKNEPIIKYLETDLSAVKKNLTIEIKKTSGIFYPLDNKWVGQGGVVSWSRTSKNIDATAELSTYEINFDQGGYTAENAKLSYPKYFGTTQITGQLKDKLISVGAGRTSSYPRFESRKESVSLNLGQGLVYTGGFKMEGTKIEGYTDSEQMCNVTHRNKSGELSYRLSGKHFSLNNENFVNAKNVEAVLYFGKDSIYHPSIIAKTDIKEQVLTLRTGDKAISKAPFYDSYHEIYINTKKLNWYPAENKLMINETRVKSGAGSQTVLIESKDFYSQKYMRRLQNVANYNPIVKLAQLVKRDGNSLSADQVATHFNAGFSVENIQTLLFDLEENGFLCFTAKENHVQVYDKVLRYAEVHAGHRDYDVIKIKSDTGGGNATLDFEKKEMELRGVKQIEFSKRQRVAANPTGKTLQMSEGRGIGFDGMLYAGYATFEGSNFSFDYDKFWLKTDSVRYLDFYLPTSNGEAFAIGSRIENAKGTLLIDAPANKSGRQDLSIFPSFKSSGSSYVFYDKNNKRKDAYPRDSFFFELDPFNFEGMRQIKPQQFAFEGKMVTAGIFPEFKETLRLQADQSLGIKTQTPATGYKIFQEKGNFNGEIILSNEGLIGKGKLIYQNTDIDSDDILFRPDNLRCSAQNFDLEKNVALGIPQVAGENVKINWNPYADSMFVESKEKSFDVFTETKHTVAGTLIYTPGGLKGRGKFKWDEGEMDAAMFDFGHFSVRSDSTDLKIQALETDALAFDTKDVAGIMDFENQIGNFKANDKDALTVMPDNQYETTLNEFEWNLGKKNITFLAPNEGLGTFTSTDSQQKKLTFSGGSAQYDFNSGKLEIGGVPYIEVADAHIFPNEAAVTILPGGKTEQLTNARILASTENKYHEIKNAIIEIHSKEKYTGKGFYDYNVGDLQQEIPFGSIVGQRVGKRTENKMETVAQANVGENAQFVIGTGFNFSGEIELRSSSPNLGYKGYASFSSEALTNPREFSIDCRADKNNLQLELDKSKDKEGQRIHTGIYLNQENRQMYTRLMMPLFSRKDQALIEVNGMTTYNAAKKEFMIGDSIKIVNPNASGNLVTFNETTGALTATGSLNILPNLAGPTIKTVGVLKSGLPEGELADPSLANEELSAKMVAGIELGLPEKLKSIVYTDFQSSSFEANTIYYKDQELYTAAIPELISDAKKIPASLQQMTKGNTFSIPGEDCTFDFLLTELNMTWDQDYQSFISTTKKIGIAALGKKAYHKSIEGIVELKQTANDESQLSLLLTSPSGNWYFFSYKNGIMNTLSSYAPYNTAVENLKSKERVLKLTGGSVEIVLGSSQMVSNCRSRAALLTSKE